MVKCSGTGTLSPDGKLLAFGSSDYTVGILDAHTFAVRYIFLFRKEERAVDSSFCQPVVTILKAHDFPPTTLRFNPESNLLISGSADNSIRVVTVPEYVPDNCEFTEFGYTATLTDFPQHGVPG